MRMFVFSKAARVCVFTEVHARTPLNPYPNQACSSCVTWCGRASAHSEWSWWTSSRSTWGRCWRATGAYVCVSVTCVLACGGTECGWCGAGGKAAVARGPSAGGLHVRVCAHCLTAVAPYSFPRSRVDVVVRRSLRPDGHVQMATSSLAVVPTGLIPESSCRIVPHYTLQQAAHTVTVQYVTFAHRAPSAGMCCWGGAAQATCGAGWPHCRTQTGQYMAWTRAACRWVECCILGLVCIVGK